MLSTLTLAATLLFAPLAADLPTPRAPEASAASSALEQRAKALRLAKRVDLMTGEEQLKSYLGNTRSGDYLAGPAGLDSDATRLRKFRRDPALATNFDSIESKWLADENSNRLFSTPRELVQAKVMIARNLFFQNVTPTRESVTAEAAHILDQRDRVANISMFGDREVVYAASADKTRRKKRNIFGRTVTQRQIERQGADLTFLQSSNGREKAALRKELSRTVSAGDASAFTFVFEGHGRSSAVKFGGSLTAADLAKMIASRSGEGEPVIVITSACDAHTLIRSVMKHLDRIAPNVTRPIFVVPVEYGQQLVRPLYGDPFFNRELGLSTKNASLGGLMERAEMATSVYVPDANNVPTQVL